MNLCHLELLFLSFMFPRTPYSKAVLERVVKLSPWPDLGLEGRVLVNNTVYRCVLTLRH